MDNEANDMDDVKCPNCNSLSIVTIDEDGMVGIGLYSIYEFIGKLYEDDVVTHECQQCLFRFSPNVT